MTSPPHCDRSAGRTQANSQGFILSCNRITCIKCCDSCIRLADGRYLGTTDDVACPVGDCQGRLSSAYTRKWSPTNVKENRACGSCMGESVVESRLNVQAGESETTGASNKEEASNKQVDDGKQKAEYGTDQCNGDGEEVLESQQSTSLFTTPSDSDHVERVAFIRDTEALENDQETPKVGFVPSETGSACTTPRNQRTIIDLTRSSPLTVMSAQRTPGNKVATHDRDRPEKAARHTKSPKEGSVFISNENSGLYLAQRLEGNKSRKPKRSRSQLSDVSNEGRSNRRRVKRWAPGENFSSQEKDRAHDDVYGLEARAQALPERGDSEDDERYSAKSSSPAQASCEYWWI